MIVAVLYSYRNGFINRKKDICIFEREERAEINPDIALKYIPENKKRVKIIKINTMESLRDERLKRGYRRYALCEANIGRGNS